MRAWHGDVRVFLLGIVSGGVGGEGPEARGTVYYLREEEEETFPLCVVNFQIPGTRE